MGVLSSSAGAKRKIDSLDGLRWIASIQIVCEHVYAKEAGGLLLLFSGWGQSWTQFFFLLSGFVLALAEMRRSPGVHLPLSKYVMHRLKSLYPTYIFLLLTYLPVVPRNEPFRWRYLPLHLLFVQGWFPQCFEVVPDIEPSCSVMWFVAPSWFLSTLLVYWLVLRSLARALRERSINFSIAVIICCWLFAFVLNWLHKDDRLAVMLGCTSRLCKTTVSQYFRFGPCGYFNVFLAGVATARIYFEASANMHAEGSEANHVGDDRLPSRTPEALRAPQHSTLLRYGCCIGFFSYLVVIFSLPYAIETDRVFFHNGGMLPIQLLILLGCAVNVDPIVSAVLASPQMLWLGRLSYVQYLGHLGLYFHIKRSGAWHLPMKVAFIPLLILYSWGVQLLISSILACAGRAADSAGSASQLLQASAAPSNYGAAAPPADPSTAEGKASA